MKLLSFGAVAAAVLLAGPASALSCMDPDIVRSYEYAAEQEEIYFLIKGSIKLDGDQERPSERALLVPGDGMEALLDPVYGSFTGEILYEGEFVPFDTNIEVRINCVGQWCGDYPDEEEALYFASAAESNMWLSVEMPACTSTRFPVSDADILISHLEKEGIEWHKDAGDGLPDVVPSSDTELPQ